MADIAEDRKPTGKMPLILALLMAFAGAGAGFFAVQSGLLANLSGSASSDAGHHESGRAASTYQPMVDTDVAFVEIDPILISLGGSTQPRHLRFRAQVEVDPGHQRDVAKLMPRIVDVLNGYLRALELADFEAPNALGRLRAQMLRRIKIVAGRNAVRDLLIMEFVLN